MRKLLFMFAALLVLAAAPGAAAPPPGISISGAELQSEVGSVEEITVIGTGVCASAGTVFLTVTIQDLETGGSGSSGTLTSCLSPGEHIRWASRPVTFNARPGDVARVTATASGAISDTDTREVIIKQFH
jgi:hypothetical protein